MANEIPKNHPRRESLLTREKIVEGWKKGLVAQVGLVAHGRGEAFDYLIDEKTTPTAMRAMKYATYLLMTAKRPVISLNGNSAVLVKDEILELANQLGRKRGEAINIEINIFYRTSERMKKLLAYMKKNTYENIRILGDKEDARIPGLASERAKCDSDGIFSSDVVFVPLEDGDRCEALRKMGKQVIAIDLNPFSRTARTASITIVDNIIRAIPFLTSEIEVFPKNIDLKNNNKGHDYYYFSNEENLKGMVREIEMRIKKFSESPIININN